VIDTWGSFVYDLDRIDQLTQLDQKQIFQLKDEQLPCNIFLVVSPNLICAVTKLERKKSIIVLGW
jgi:hypothetical protein